MSLAIYRWEREKFPWAHRVQVLPKYRIGIAQALLKQFADTRARVELSTRGNGRAWGTSLIALPGYAYPCNLALIIHEVAHIRAACLGSKGHDAIFKKALIKVHVETRTMRLLPKMFAEIRKELAEQENRTRKDTERLARHLDRKLAQKALRKTRAYKMERLRERVKRLEAKAKRTDTALKSARRSLAAYERAEQLARAKDLGPRPQEEVR